MKSTQTTIIASLCAIMLIVSGTQIAEATHLKKAEDLKSSKSFGLKTSYMVCGDMVCLKVTKNDMSDMKSNEKPNDNSSLQESIVKKESTKNNKKAEAKIDAMKFWEQYYKQSAPITK